MSTSALVLGLGVLCVPWPVGVRAPAVMGAEHAQWLYAPISAQIKTLTIRRGDDVTHGQTVVSLTSADLEHRIATALVREQSMQWKLAQQPLNADLQGLGTALREQWSAAKAELEGLVTLRDQLDIRASVGGRVTAVTPGLEPGVWVRRGEPMVQVVSSGAIRVDVFVVGRDIAQVQVGDSARFLPAHWQLPAVACRVASLDRVALSHLDHAFLGSPHGGPLPASVNAQGQTVPLQGVFRVRLDQCEGNVSAGLQEQSGVATIGSSGRSLLLYWIGELVTLWNKEASL